MQVLIVADDLTGALDSVVAFANRGMRSSVLRHPAALAGFDVDGVDVLAVSTGSRDGSAEAAGTAVRAVVEALGGQAPRHVFKKVDSRLKGHVGLEAAALAEGFGRLDLLVAPAIPDMGRVVRSGQVVGMGVDAPIDIAVCFAGQGLLVEAPDVESHADFDRALDGADRQNVLLVGARGLAAALADRLAPGGDRKTLGALRLPALFAIGSRDPITERQVERLCAERQISLIPAKNGVFPSSAHLDCGLTLAKLTAGREALPAHAAGRQFAEGVARIIEAEVPATLLGCGGETANALLERFSVDRLDVIAEILPGVPLSRGTICGKTVDIITKSGGFGDAGTLVALADRIETRHAGAPVTAGRSAKAAFIERAHGS